MPPSATSLEGKRVPDVTFKTRVDDRWKDVTADDVFRGRTVVAFGLPGAYTPTCSSAHLPRYDELADVFKANGVDEIVCLSVNDAFVMNEWKQTQEAGSITLLPDGNGEFAAGMGMLVDKSGPVVIFAKPGGPHCARAKVLLESRGYRYDEFTLGKRVT